MFLLSRAHDNTDNRTFEVSAEQVNSEMHERKNVTYESKTDSLFHETVASLVRLINKSIFKQGKKEKRETAGSLFSGMR